METLREREKIGFNIQVFGKTLVHLILKKRHPAIGSWARPCSGPGKGLPPWEWGPWIPPADHLPITISLLLEKLIKNSFSQAPLTDTFYTGNLGLFHGQKPQSLKTATRLFSFLKRHPPIFRKWQIRLFLDKANYGSLLLLALKGPDKIDQARDGGLRLALFEQGIISP